MLYLNDRMPYRSRSRWERGQSLVETAIGFVFFMAFLLGVLDIGRLYFIYIALEDSAGEAAIFLSINPECLTPADCPDPNNAEWRAKNAAGENLDWENIEVYSEYPNGGPGIGNTVRVRLEYQNFELLTPIISEIVGSGTITLETSATQTILVED